MQCISVIIPVYNAQDYLEACLNSVLRQTYRDIEVILIDDGSTDLSLSICRKYEKADERVKLITQPNFGPSAARNAGMKIAKGEYWFFVDGDDVVSDHLIEHLWDVLNASEADISVCDFCHCDANSPAEFSESTETCVFSKEEAIKEMLYQKSFTVSASGKLFRRMVFEDQYFPEGKRFEDSAIMYKIFDRAERIVYSNARLYGYRHHGNSITTGEFSKHDCDILEITDNMADYFSGRGSDLLAAAKAYQTNAALRVLLNAPKTEEYQEARNDCRQLIWKNFLPVLFDRNIRSKLRIGLILVIFFRPLVPIIYKKVDRWK